MSRAENERKKRKQKKREKQASIHLGKIARERAALSAAAAAEGLPIDMYLMKRLLG